MVPTRRGRVDATKIQVNKRAAIQFKPFNRSVDPRTGKAIAPNARVTLPNGKTVTATAYFDALDTVEKNLNAQGYSLRGPEKVITLTQLVAPKQLLDKQARAILAMHKAPAGNPPPRPSGKQVLDMLRPIAEQDNKKVQPALLKLGPAIPTTTVQWNRPWSYVFGDPSSFYASFSGHVEVKGTTGNYGTINKVSGEVIANGSIFNVGEEMLHGTGSITSHPNGATDLSLKVDVAGNTIYNKTTSVSLPQWHEGASRDFDWSVSLPVDLDFGISLDATIGAKGTANGEFAFTATPTGLYTNTHGYAKATSTVPLP